MSIRQAALSHLRAIFAEASPRLRLVFWDGDAFDFAALPTVVITFSSPDQWRSLLRGDFSALGEAYVNGGLKVDGRPADIIETGVRLSERLEKSPTFGFLKSMANLTALARSLDQDAANVRRHYDVSNEFYKLWLDKRLVYSCAYFHDGTENIDLAQEHKLDHICRKLRLQADEKLLDVGCGWGATFAVGCGALWGARLWDYAERTPV